MSNRPSLVRAWSDGSAILHARGWGPARIASLVLLWPACALLVWSLATPDPAVLAANGVAIGMDGHAYWAAWSHGLYDGSPRDIDAFLYSPAFAQLLWPLTLLSFSGFVVVWWGLICSTFVYLLWPLPWVWRYPALVLMGFELQAGNINAFLALMLVLALRQPSLWAFALLTKITLGVLLFWHVVRREQRQLVIAMGTTIAFVIVSCAVAPELWRDWVSFLVREREAPKAAGWLGTSSLPFRLLLAAVVVSWGASRDRSWTLAVGALLATPLLGLTSISLLAAVPRLLERDEQQRHGQQQQGPERRAVNRSRRPRLSARSAGRTTPVQE